MNKKLIIYIITSKIREYNKKKSPHMSKPHDFVLRIISRRLFKLFLTVPAVSAKFVGVDTDRINHIVKAMIAKRGKVKFLANFVDHILIFFTVGVGIFV